METRQEKGKDYPFLRAWNRCMAAASEGWNLWRARQENAPQNAIYARADGSWATVEDIKAADLKAFITRDAEKISERRK